MQWREGYGCKAGGVMEGGKISMRCMDVERMEGRCQADGAFVLGRG